MFARKIRGIRPRALAAGESESRAGDRGNAIIGHRLPTGKLYIHPPVEPCVLCDRVLRQVQA